MEYLYTIQYNQDNTPRAIGTITEREYKTLYDGAKEQLTVLRKDLKELALEKILITENYDVYKLARELHRQSIQ